MPSPLEEEYNRLLETWGAKAFLVKWEGDDKLLQKICREIDQASGGESKESLRSTSGLSDILQMIFNLVQQSAAEYAMSCPIDVFVGEFPTGSFNAQAIRVKSGALLLINDGLMTFIHQCAKIYTHSIAINFSSNVKPLPPLLNRQESIDALANVLIAYLFGGHAHLAPRLPIGDGPRIYLTSQLTTHAEWFVIGHEYGHAIAGHLTEPKATHPFVSSSGDKIEVISKTWKQEIEADALGLAFLIPPSVQNSISSQEELDNFMLRLAGPFLFFALDELRQASIDQLIGEKRRFDVTLDHPPTLLRMSAMLEALKHKQEKSPHLYYVDVILEWFREITPAVASAVHARYQALKSEIRH